MLQQEYLLLPQNQLAYSNSVYVYLIIGGLVAPSMFQPLYAASYGPSEAGCDARCQHLFRGVSALGFLTAVLAMLAGAIILGLLGFRSSPTKGYVHEHAIVRKCVCGLCYPIMQFSMIAALGCWLATYIIAAMHFLNNGLDTGGTWCTVLIVIGGCSFAALMILYVGCYIVSCFQDLRPKHAYDVSVYATAQALLECMGDQQQVDILVWKLLKQCQEQYRIHVPEGPLPRQLLHPEDFKTMLDSEFGLQTPGKQVHVVTMQLAVVRAAYEHMLSQQWHEFCAPKPTSKKGFLSGFWQRVLPAQMLMNNNLGSSANVSKLAAAV